MRKINKKFNKIICLILTAFSILTCTPAFAADISDNSTEISTRGAVYTKKFYHRYDTTPTINIKLFNITVGTAKISIPTVRAENWEVDSRGNKLRYIGVDVYIDPDKDVKVTSYSTVPGTTGSVSVKSKSRYSCEVVTKATSVLSGSQSKTITLYPYDVGY